MAKVITSLSQLNKDSVQKILQDYFEDPTVEVTKVSGLETFLGDNENFASEIKSCLVTIKRNGLESELSFVVKSTSESSFFKKFSTIFRPFAKEIFWFKRGHPTLTSLCPELKDLTPICYYGFSSYQDQMFSPKNVLDRSILILRRTILDKPEDGFIVLDNLRFGNSPMKMLDKTKLMTLDQARVVFQAMARLHGSWLKWKKHETRNSQIGSLDGIRPEDAKSLEFEMQPWMAKASFKSVQRLVARVLQSHGKSDLSQKWDKYSKERMFQRSMKMVSTKSEFKSSKIVTLCHGDLWTNNMMFTEDETKVTFLDYQIILILHPARDIWYFLSAASDAEFRTAHLRNLLQDYFEIFKGYLEQAEIQMNFQQFEAEVLERRDLLLVYTPSLIPTFLSTEKIEITTWRAFKELMKKREEDIGASPQPDDPPNLVEIRRRIIGLVQEAADCKFI